MALVSLSLFEYMNVINFISSISLCHIYLRTWLQIKKIGYFIASISLCHLYLRTWLQIMTIDWIFHCLHFLVSSLFEDMTTDYEDRLDISLPPFPCVIFIWGHDYILWRLDDWFWQYIPFDGVVQRCLF